MKRTLFAGLLCAVALPLWAADPAKPAGTLIDFRVEVQKPVANDLGRASAYAETTGSDPADVAHKIKTLIAAGLATAKAQPHITVKSGGTHTYPVYSKGGRQIESWRMRSEILLESRDAAALSAAVGKLQGTLAIGGIHFSPAAETRRQAEDEATLEAIEAFRTKAGRIADAMKRSYRIRQMNLGGGHQNPPQPMFRAAALMAESAPMPAEAGTSNLTVEISGQIELQE